MILAIACGKNVIQTIEDSVGFTRNATIVDDETVIGAQAAPIGANVFSDEHVPKNTVVRIEACDVKVMFSKKDRAKAKGDFQI